MKKNILKDQKSQSKAMNEAARNSRDVSHPVGKKNKKKDSNRVRGRGTEFVTPKRLGGPLHPKLDEYFRSLADPWKINGIRCPVNFNPVPSFITQYARTTSVITQHPVAANQSQTLILWPGHTNLYAPPIAAIGVPTGGGFLSDFDEVSYHEPYVFMGATTYVVGPMSFVDGSSTTRAPIIGVLLNQLGVSGQVGGPMSGASVPLTYGQALPYTGTSLTSGHSRWKLVSMGLVIKNTTPELTRGGALISFQPINNDQRTSVAAAVGTYMNIPTWKDHGSDSLRLSWIPRMRDVAFWHGTNVLESGGNVPVSTSPGVPGIVVSFQTPTSGQTYDIEVVCNWELAGDLFLPIGTPSVHMPEAKPVVERVHSKLINTEPGAQKALSIAREAHEVVKEVIGIGHQIIRGVKAGAQLAGFA